jgi:hypothetical protein
MAWAERQGRRGWWWRGGEPRARPSTDAQLCCAAQDERSGGAVTLPPRSRDGGELRPHLCAISSRESDSPPSSRRFAPIHFPRFAGEELRQRCRWLANMISPSDQRCCPGCLSSPLVGGAGRMQSRRGSCQCLLAQADARLHAPRGLTVCPGVAIGVAGSTHQGGSPGVLAPLPVTGSACRDLSVRPRTLRFHFGGSAPEVRFTAPTGRGRIRPLPVETICLRGRCLLPHTSCATPASAPDILSSDAFQDLPSSGADAVYVSLGAP